MSWLQLKARFETTPRQRSAPLRALAAVTFALVQLVPLAAWAEEGDDVQACASAYEQAQVARNDGRLVEAQDHLRICVQDHCPDFVKSDCGQWLSDIKRDIPSVIFSPVDASGQELLEVKVSVDGKEVTLDGRAVELDPGQHDVTYEYEGKTRTEKVAIRQGEKNRVVKLEISTDKDSDGDGILDSTDQCPTEVGPAPEGCPEEAPPDLPQGPDPSLRLAAYVSWGVGGAGLLTWGVFGVLGKSADDDARKKCPTPSFCTKAVEDDLVDDVDGKYLIANIGLGVGIAGAATGTVLFFLSMPKEEKTASDTALTGPSRSNSSRSSSSRSSSSRSSSSRSDSPFSLGVRPTNGGGTLSLGGAF